MASKTDCQYVLTCSVSNYQCTLANGIERISVHYHLHYMCMYMYMDMSFVSWCSDNDLYLFLCCWQPKEKSAVSPPTHKRSSERHTEHGGPRTLRDYQELTSKPKGRAKRGQDEDLPAPTMEPDELHKYLVAYVNSELNLHPPLPAKGSALFETCSNPTNLW